MFSPNGIGPEVNNSICVKGDCISNFSYAVYNRWGEKVFETSAQSICWDGTYKGKELNPGVFTYSLKVTLTNGDIVLESGNVTLVK
jgi:gliding motility-associated-like protein